MEDYRSAHSSVLKEINETDIAKDHDYGGSFYLLLDKHGARTSVIRLWDKLSRFEVLTFGAEAQVKDESVRDTLLDMANYCIKTIAWMDVQKQDKAQSEQSQKEWRALQCSGCGFISNWEEDEDFDCPHCHHHIYKVYHGEAVSQEEIESIVHSNQA